MRQRRDPNVVAVALANKHARIVWSLLASDSADDASLSVGAA
jgi:transposase